EERQEIGGLGECSTPYGIRGSVSRGAAASLSRLACAQRLTASEDQSGALGTAPSARPHCAQRLTASEDQSGADMGTIWSHSISCSTPYGIRGSVRSKPS